MSEPKRSLFKELKQGLEESLELTKLLSLIKTEWHEEFTLFIGGHDVSEDFLQYLDDSKCCQTAVIKAFRIQVTAFRRIGGHDA